MDIAELKARVVTLRHLLKTMGYRLDGAILFGSRAKGTHTPQSDVDLAVISRDFGVDRHRESVLLNRIAFRTIPYCDAIPVGLRDYLDPHPVSPILHEIKAHGTLLL